MKSENADFIKQKAFAKLALVMDRIFNRKMVIFTRNNLWEAVWGFPLLWLVPLFPLLYLIIGKVFMAKLMFANNDCVSCGLCAKMCPNQAIVMKGTKSKRTLLWTYHCEACLRCMGYCGKRAIEAGHSWGVLLYFVTAVPVMVWLMTWLQQVYGIASPTNFWLRMLLDYIYAFPAMLLAYWLFWNLVRLPIINKIFTYTTLTRYFRRYHETGMKLKDFRRKN